MLCFGRVCWLGMQSCDAQLLGALSKMVSLEVLEPEDQINSGRLFLPPVCACARARGCNNVIEAGGDGGCRREHGPQEQEAMMRLSWVPIESPGVAFQRSARRTEGGRTGVA